MTPYRERREAGEYLPSTEPKDVIEERAGAVAVEERNAEELREENGDSGEPASTEESVAYGRRPNPPSEEPVAAPKRPRGRPRKNPLPEQ